MKVLLCGLPRAEILLALYNNANGRGARYASTPAVRITSSMLRPGKIELAEKLIDAATEKNYFYFDTIDLGSGPKKIDADLSDWELDCEKYDSYHGTPGYAAQVIERLHSETSSTEASNTCIDSERISAIKKKAMSALFTAIPQSVVGGATGFVPAAVGALLLSNSDVKTMAAIKMGCLGTALLSGSIGLIHGALSRNHFFAQTDNTYLRRRVELDGPDRIELGNNSRSFLNYLGITMFGELLGYALLNDSNAKILTLGEAISYSAVGSGVTIIATAVAFVSIVGCLGFGIGMQSLFSNNDERINLSLQSLGSA